MPRTTGSASRYEHNLLGGERSCEIVKHNSLRQREEDEETEKVRNGIMMQSNKRQLTGWKSIQPQLRSLSRREGIKFNIGRLTVLIALKYMHNSKF